jgi:hypothetical protein
MKCDNIPPDMMSTMSNDIQHPLKAESLPPNVTETRDYVQPPREDERSDV